MSGEDYIYQEMVEHPGQKQDQLEMSIEAGGL